MASLENDKLAFIRQNAREVSAVFDTVLQAQTARLLRTCTKLNSPSEHITAQHDLLPVALGVLKVLRSIIVTISAELHTPLSNPTNKQLPPQNIRIFDSTAEKVNGSQFRVYNPGHARIGAFYQLNTPFTSPVTNTAYAALMRLRIAVQGKDEITWLEMSIE